MRKAVVTAAGGVTAAFLASLCCVGPLLFVSLGIGAVQTGDIGNTRNRGHR